MKKIEKEVKREREELLAENKEFLEGTLYPIADANASERKSKRKKLHFALPAAILTVVICSVGFGVWKYARFHISYETKRSDIESLNGMLKNTRLEGELGTILLTYETRRNSPVYFRVYQEQEEAEVYYVMVSMNVLIDRKQKTEDITTYTEQAEYSGYTLYYRENEVIDRTDAITVYGYKVNAFMDTGAERYILEYSEFRTDDDYGFWQYLQETIKQK